jgi:hypothetical protein
MEIDWQQNLAGLESNPPIKHLSTFKNDEVTNNASERAS